MSKIVKFYKSATDARGSKASEVNCVYEKSFLPDNTPCVVLKTYNPNSQNASVSQTLHITKDIALRLIEIFTEELSL